MPYIEIEGYAALDRALKELSIIVERDFTGELRRASEPVRIRSEELAMSEISGMKRFKTVNWSEMRLGSTTKGVYEAPKHRRSVGQPRPNLAGLLMRKSMRPALDQEFEKVEMEVEGIIDRSLERVGF